MDRKIMIQLSISALRSLFTLKSFWRASFIFLLLSLPISSFAEIYIEPGKLYNFCKTARLFNEYRENDQLTSKVNMRLSYSAMKETGICEGYIVGVLNGNWHISIPDNVPLDDMVSIFISYMDKHPELKKLTAEERISKGSFLYPSQIIVRSLIESGRVECYNKGSYGSCKDFLGSITSARDTPGALTSKK